MRAIRGDDPISICNEQKNLALLTLAGEVRRGISNPKGALAESVAFSAITVCI